jgi:hypothetical protein
VSLLAKSKWNDVKEKLVLIEGWARNGLTDEQIGKNLGISKDTFYRYKKEHQDFSDALKKGKEVIDFEVENALLKKALGFKETVKKGIKVKDVIYNNGKRERETETIELVDEEIYIVPDTTAQIFWLKNRKPLAWRDKQELNHSGEMNINNPFKSLSDEELKNLAKLSDENG